MFFKFYYLCYLWCSFVSFYEVCEMGFKDFCGLGKRIDLKIKQPLDHVYELAVKGGAQVIEI